MKRSVLFLIAAGLLLVPTHFGHAQLCEGLFSEGTGEYIVCTDYLTKGSAIREQDLRMQMIGQRVANLLTSVEVNGDDAAWVERIRPAIAELTDEYRTLFEGLQVFVAGEVFLVRTALADRAGSVADKLLSPVIADLDYFERTLYTAWDAVGSDIELLNRDLNDALVRLASQEVSDTDAQQEAGQAPGGDAAATEAVPVQSAARSAAAGDVMAGAAAACEGVAEGRELQSCLFREAWISLNAADYCDDGNVELCDEMRIWFSDYSEETWEQLIAEYGAADDAKAGIAVLICQLNPVTREDGSVVPLGTCAEVEYMGLTGAVAGTMSNQLTGADNVGPSTGPTGEDADTPGNADEMVPRLGDWMVTIRGGCPGAELMYQVVEASAERIRVSVAGFDAEVYMMTEPGTYVRQVQGGIFLPGTVETLSVVPGDPERIAGVLELPNGDRTISCSLDGVFLNAAD